MWKKPSINSCTEKLKLTICHLHNFQNGSQKKSTKKENTEKENQILFKSRKVNLVFSSISSAMSSTDLFVICDLNLM